VSYVSLCPLEGLRECGSQWSEYTRDLSGLMDRIVEAGRGELVLSGAKYHPRVGTRVERAEEGRCEGEDGVGVAPSVRSDIFAKHTFRCPQIRRVKFCRRIQ